MQKTSSDLTLHNCALCFNLPIQVAAKELQISRQNLKKFLKGNGVEHWPYMDIKENGLLPYWDGDMARSVLSELRCHGSLRESFIKLLSESAQQRNTLAAGTHHVRSREPSEPRSNRAGPSSSSTLQTRSPKPDSRSTRSRGNESSEQQQHMTFKYYDTAREWQSSLGSEEENLETNETFYSQDIFDTIPCTRGSSTECHCYKCYLMY